MFQNVKRYSFPNFLVIVVYISFFLRFLWKHSWKVCLNSTFLLYAWCHLLKVKTKNKEVFRTIWNICVGTFCKSSLRLLFIKSFRIKKFVTGVWQGCKDTYAIQNINLEVFFTQLDMCEYAGFHWLIFYALSSWGFGHIY